MRQLFAALALTLRDCREELNAQQLENALLGLQRMSDAHQEVRQLLLAFAPLVATCREELAPAAGGSALPAEERALGDAMKSTT